jgi:hypothetical protein
MGRVSDAEARKPVTLAREELYAQVWTTPISGVAFQYVSGNGLQGLRAPSRALCATRPLGRKAVGKTVTRVPCRRKTVARRLTVGLKVPGKLTHPHRVVAGWVERPRRIRAAWLHGDGAPPA